MGSTWFWHARKATKGEGHISNQTDLLLLYCVRLPPLIMILRDRAAYRFLSFIRSCGFPPIRGRRLPLNYHLPAVVVAVVARTCHVPIHRVSWHTFMSCASGADGS